jgi:hypothetical protein
VQRPPYQSCQSFFGCPPSVISRSNVERVETGRLIHQKLQLSTTQPDCRGWVNRGRFQVGPACRIRTSRPSHYSFWSWRRQPRCPYSFRPALKIVFFVSRRVAHLDWLPLACLVPLLAHLSLIQCFVGQIRLGQDSAFLRWHPLPFSFQQQPPPQRDSISTLSRPIHANRPQKG